MAANLDLTDAEAKAFWPVYERYQKDLGATRDTLFQVVEEDTLQSVKLTDQKALELVPKSEQLLHEPEAAVEVALLE